MQKKFPGGRIPTSLFEAMKEEYRLKRLDLINKELGIDDTQKTWYSKKTIYDIFKATGATADIADQFGLEIHYGVVPKDRQGADIPDDYVGLHNVILLATKNEDIAAKDGEDDRDPYDNGTLCPP